MSEYQYYEFLAVDRPLTPAEMKRLRKLSTRAEITATRFSNEYNYGDFGGSPEDMMDEYFDAHVYVANWGTYTLMLRFPRGLIDEELLREYCIDDPFSFRIAKKHLIISWDCNLEEGEDWVEGEGWMGRLVQIRNEIEKGDYRSLYIGFLLTISMYFPDDDIDDDTMEPPVPPGLASPTAAQKSLMEFLHLDQDLVAAGAMTSEPLVPQKDQAEDMLAWINQLQDDEMRQMLLRVLKGEASYVQRELNRRYNQFLKQSKASDGEDDKNPRRMVSELFALVEAAEKKRLEVEARKLGRRRATEERKRRKYLAELLEQFPEKWEKVEGFAERQNASAYKEAVALLVDLSEAYDQAERTKEFNTRFSQFLSKNQRRSALIKRIDEAGLKRTVRVV